MPLHLLNPMKLQTMHLVAIVTRLGESRPLFSAVLPIRVSLTTHDMFVTTNRMVYERGDTGTKQRHFLRLIYIRSLGES